MSLENLLAEKRTAIIKRWFELVINTYPADARRFLGEEKDRFANPVGQTISRNLEIIYDELRGAMEVTRLADALTEIVKVRAVQDFSPSRAVGFIFLVKPALREELRDELGRGEAEPELSAFERRVDQAALLAFDLYMQSKEKIAELLSKESQARTRFLDRRLAAEKNE